MSSLWNIAMINTTFLSHDWENITYFSPWQSITRMSCQSNQMIIALAYICCLQVGDNFMWFSQITGCSWIPRSNGQQREPAMYSLLFHWSRCWAYSPAAGDFRRHGVISRHTHHGGATMCIQFSKSIWKSFYWLWCTTHVMIHITHAAGHSLFCLNVSLREVDRRISAELKHILKLYIIQVTGFICIKCFF